jgi:hypothetical protein
VENERLGVLVHGGLLLGVHIAGTGLLRHLKDLATLMAKALVSFIELLFIIRLGDFVKLARAILLFGDIELAALALSVYDLLSESVTNFAAGRSAFLTHANLLQ